MAIISAVLSSLIGGGSGGASAAISSKNAPNPMGLDDISQLLALESRFKPNAYSSGLSALEGQSAYGVGADPGQLALELTSRAIEQSSNANEARKFQKYYGDLQSLAPLQQQGGLTPQQQKIYDKALKQVNLLLSTRGGAASLSIGADGMPSLTLSNPAQQQLIDAARQNSSQIQANRLQGQQNLSKLAADFPMATGTDLQNLINQYQTQISGEVNNTYDTATNNALQLANTRGYNPAGQVGLLDQQRVRDLLAIPTTAADRALQILGGKQQLAMGSIAGTNAALSPDSTIAIMNALRNQQTPTTGQLAAAQLASYTSLANNRNSEANQTGRTTSGQVSSSLGGYDIAGLGSGPGV